MLLNLANKILRKIKGDEYVLSTEIPAGYLFALLTNRSIMFFRGKLSFIKNDGTLFIGRKTRLSVKSKMQFGKGITLDDECTIHALSTGGVRFGNGVSLGKRSVIECTGSLRHLGKGIIVGNNVGLGRDCFYGCAGGIEIGDDTIFGNFVSLHSENHNAESLSIPIRLQGVNHKGIKVGRNCWIGAKVTILDGVEISDGCIIAAGAVVTAGFYPPDTIFGGIPARALKKRTEL